MEKQIATWECCFKAGQNDETGEDEEEHEGEDAEEEEEEDE